MLWHDPYDTRRLGELPADGATVDGLEVGDAVLIVGGVAALREFGVWMRLVESDFGSEAWRGILALDDAKRFEQYLPPSQFARCVAKSPDDMPMEDGRVLAGVYSGSTLLAVMVGPPTEEAWDEFSAAMKTFRT